MDGACRSCEHWNPAHGHSSAHYAEPTTGWCTCPASPYSYTYLEQSCDQHSAEAPLLRLMEDDDDDG